MSNSFSPIPFHRPSLGPEEQEEVAQVLASGWLTTGPKAAQFEEEFRLFVNARCIASVSSGTAGLHVALEGLGIGLGDEVITTPLTFCATVQAIIHTGAKPVLADVGLDGNIDPDSVASRITSRTAAILPVHLAGLPCNLGRLWTLARAHDLLVIEDAAHALGARYDGRLIGASQEEGNYRSDAVVFSLYATKNITSAEGGMVTTWREDLAGRIRRLSLHGIDRDTWARQSKKQSWKYDVVETGWKYNLSDLQAAVGLAQLRKFPGLLHRRRQIAKFYNEQFAALEELELPPGIDSNSHACHLYSLRLHLDKLRIDRDSFIEELAQRGIGASVHFIPIPLHSAFAQQSREWQESCPQAMTLYHRLLSIPLYPALSAEESERIVQTVTDIVSRFRRLQFTGYTGTATELILNRRSLITPEAELHYEPLFRSAFENRRILVTGAAGSIGRRLCQRLLAFGPNLIGFDRSEHGVFQLSRDLGRQFNPQMFSLVIGDVCDEALMRETIERFAVDTVIHAAAYKHVPLMEQHPLEAIRNNVIGTWRVVNAAAKTGLQSVLLISTDKAANPVGIMGKTKRVSEQMITAFSAQCPHISSASLRLGNVLGSDGSVSSTLIAQLREHLPVTITHPEVQRYFLTPEETVHYILRALLLNGAGEIFVPEMGAPVRILDLAQRLARTEARTLDLRQDINIIGLRPGEKILEDLKSDNVEFQPTNDCAIKAVRESAPSWPDLVHCIALIEESVALRNAEDALLLLEHLTSKNVCASAG